MGGFLIRPVNDQDRDWVRGFITEQWGDSLVVAHGAIYYPHDLPGFIALQNHERVGLLTYRIVRDQCEIVSLNSTRSGLGIGTALIEAVKQTALQAGCQRLWLSTTNDNLNALRFYQKRGFRLVAVHRDALDRARQIKPSIPLIGHEGIPLCDEIELEMILVF